MALKVKVTGGRTQTISELQRDLGFAGAPKPASGDRLRDEALGRSGDDSLSRLGAPGEHAGRSDVAAADGGPDARGGAGDAGSLDRQATEALVLQACLQEFGWAILYSRVLDREILLWASPRTKAPPRDILAEGRQMWGMEEVAHLAALPDPLPTLKAVALVKDVFDWGKIVEMDCSDLIPARELFPEDHRWLKGRDD